MIPDTLPRLPVYSELQLHGTSKYPCLTFVPLCCRWKKASDNRKIMVERHDIWSLRVKYLHAIKAYREEGEPIVYTDEAFVHSSHTIPHTWDDGSGAGLEAPVSKGRLIILHAHRNT